MKHFLLLLTALLTMLAAAAQNWQYQNPFPAPVNLNAVYFADTLKGVVAGDCGTLLKTNDGGINWTGINAGSCFSRMLTQDSQLGTMSMPKVEITQAQPTLL
jgi:photosystem II stability/assembly factor-like uncharacterized protein